MATDADKRLYAKKRRDRYRYNKAQAIRYLGGKCVWCGDDDPENLEFNHIDPYEKVQHVTKTLNKKYWKDSLAEIDKCELLCSRCHKIHTFIYVHPGNKNIFPWEHPLHQDNIEKDWFDEQEGRTG